MKLLEFLTATTTLNESLKQVYHTMNIVSEIQKWDGYFSEMREAWVGGIADFGDPQAAIEIQKHPEYDTYRESLTKAVGEYLGDPFVAYRLMSEEQIEEWQSGADMPAIAVSTELDIAKAFRKLAANRGRDDLRVVQLSVPASAVIMLGHSREHELVIDANWISAHEIEFLNEGVEKVYWEDLPDDEQDRLRALRVHELKNLTTMDYPFPAKFMDENVMVQGPVGRFPPYDTHPSKETEEWKSAFQQMVNRPDGSRAIMMAYSLVVNGKPLVTSFPPTKKKRGFTLPTKPTVSEAVLLELQEIGDPSKLTGRELRDQLEDAGWAKIGDEDTSYSDVYGKADSPWAVKLLKVSQRGETNENFQCAMKWYRYCLQNWQSNPHLPRIPFVKTLRADYTIGDDGYRKDDVTGHRTYVVMIELLDDFYVNHYEWRREDPVDNAIMWSVMAAVAGVYKFKWFDNDDMEKAFTTLLRLLPKIKVSGLVHKYREGFYDDSGGRRDIQSEPWSDSWFASLTTAMLHSGGFTEIAAMMENGMKVAAERGNLIAIAMKHIHESGCDIDLHIGNVMVRPSTNELVITDPVKG